MEGMALLERAIRRELYGEDGRGGLLRGLMACQTLDDLNRTKGAITAYENVLGMMEQVYRQLHGQDEPYSTGSQRPRAN